MTALLFVGAILSWVVGGVVIVGSGSAPIQIIGAIAILNGTVAVVGGLVLDSLEQRRANSEPPK